MKHEVIFKAGIGIASVLGIAACNSEAKHSPVTTHVESNTTSGDAATGTSSYVFDKVACHVDTPQNWTKTPANLNFTKIAVVLKVSQEQVREGSYGPATCDDAVQVKDIPTGMAPHPTIEGHGNSCLIIGTQVDPSTIRETKSVIALCANDALAG